MSNRQSDSRVVTPLEVGLGLVAFMGLYMIVSGAIRVIVLVGSWIY